MPSMPSTITFLPVAVPAVGPDWQQVSARGRNRPGSHAHRRRPPRGSLPHPDEAMVLLVGAPGRLSYTTRHDTGGPSA